MRERTDGQAGGQTNGRADGLTDGRTDGRTDLEFAQKNQADLHCKFSNQSKWKMKVFWLEEN